MKAYFVTSVGMDRLRLTFGSNTIEASPAKIAQLIADAVKEQCQDMQKDTAYRFEFCDVLPSRSLANAIHELESLTRAKEAFYLACKDGRSMPERRELFDNMVTLATTMNLDNLWHALGVTGPDQAA